MLLFGIVRNIPVYPFNLLVPGACLNCFKFAAHRKAGKQEAKKKLLCKPDKAEERKDK